MKQIIEVKEVSKYSFVDKETGQLIEGVVIQYEEPIHNNPNKKGLERIQMKSQNMSLYEKVNVIPAKYEVDFHIKPMRSGVQIVVDDINLVK